MAVYNQVLLYTFRDSLASGDPQKVIFGAYLDGEFGAIHTASLDAVSLSGNNTIAGNNSFTGTNTFSGAGITTTFAGKIVAGPPSAGATVSMTAASATTTAVIITGSSAGQALIQFGANAGANNGFVGTVGAAAQVVTDSVLGDTVVRSATGIRLTANGGTSTNVLVGSAGNVTVNAPSSGAALSLPVVTGASVNNPGLQVANNSIITFLDSTGATTNAGFIWYDNTNKFTIGTGNSSRVSVSATGNVTIAAPSSGTGLAVTGLANSFAGAFTGSSTSGQSRGLEVLAGTNSSDYALLVNNQANSVSYFEVRGDGTILGGGPVAATLVDMTPDKGSFTATLSGGTTTNPTATVNWVKMGNIVMMDCVAGLTATSNSTANPLITGVPASLVGARNSNFPCTRVFDNSVTTPLGYVVTNVSGQITFSKETAFTAANAKGINAGASWMYSLA